MLEATRDHTSVQSGHLMHTKVDMQLCVHHVRLNPSDRSLMRNCHLLACWAPLPSYLSPLPRSRRVSSSWCWSNAIGTSTDPA